VNYPSNWASSSPAAGAADVIRYFSTKPQQCPDQKYVLSGYSQGAIVMHQAAIKLDKAILRNRIIATATFGDPGQKATKAKAGTSPGGNAPIWPAELVGKIKFNCNKGDPTCTPGGSNIMAHANYLSGSFVQDSAKYIQKKFLKSRGGSGDMSSTRTTFSA
jgi:cutinase